MNKILKIMKTNNMSKLLLWFFIYTIVTFTIGIICKVLVAWHVNEMHSAVSTTRDLFKTASQMPGGDIVIGNTKLTIGDLYALDYISHHINEISGGDGDPNVFLIYSKHVHDARFAEVFKKLEDPAFLSALEGIKTNLKDFVSLNMSSQSLQGFNTNIFNNLNGQNGSLDFIGALTNFQSDIAKDAIAATRMASEANEVFWLQISLLILTFAAYPYGIFKLWQVKHNLKFKYNAKMHTRLIIEYVIFLVFFIAIDSYATYLLIAEHVPMTFWNAFSVGSMAIPTGFAFGSLIYIYFLRKEITDPQNFKFKMNFKFLNKNRAVK